MIKLYTKVSIYTSFGSSMEPVLKGTVIGYGSIDPTKAKLDDTNDAFVYLVKPDGETVVDKKPGEVRVLDIIAVPRDRIQVDVLRENGDEIFPLERFIELCKDEVLMEGDGGGIYASVGHMSTKAVYPSDITSGNIDREYTHVVWYKR